MSESVDEDDTVVVYYNMDCGMVYSTYLATVMKWVEDHKIHATLVTTWVVWPHTIAHVWIIPNSADRMSFAICWA